MSYDLEKISDLSKVTQLGSSRARTQRQFSVSKVVLLTRYPVDLSKCVSYSHRGVTER